MITLAIDQSSVQASAALLDGDCLLAQRDWQDDRSRGSRLFGCIDEMLLQARVKAESLERFVVGVGPGSYTGLRTSIMAARAMAMPGRKPVLGVSSGDAIAERAGVSKATIYRHWESRDEVLLDVIERCRNLSREELERMRRMLTRRLEEGA